jgi:hypothetical protein
MADRLGRYRDKRNSSTTKEPGLDRSRKRASTKSARRARTVEQVVQEHSGNSK